ncbi:hypothetical protein QCA50_018508 [Cerrena zonata]|uniref:Cytochrome P450 n=1 Tax=Cerrena zonata TaxID=2478898 RepID=A0AAW0FCG9_9APHY
MHQLMFWDWNMGFMPYSQMWRNHRREFHQFFNQREVTNYRSFQLRECRSFLRRVLTSSYDDLGLSVRQIFTAIIVKITYDMDIVDFNDDYIVLAEKGVEGFSLATVPGVYWVEYFPILKYIPSWVPGTYSKKMAEYYRPIVESLRNKPFDQIKDGMMKGEITTPSVASTLIEKLSQESREEGSNTIDEELARNVAGVAYAAAADTTTSAGQSFLIAMSLYPDVQRKGQDELDRVVGPNRLPEFDDYDDLVYIRAIVLESMRWMVVTPLSLPHALIREDEYRGYRIPKGSIISANVWLFLCHDSSLFKR